MRRPAMIALTPTATRLLCAGLLLFIAGCGGGDDDVGAPSTTIASLRLVGSTSIPTGTLYEGVEFGGISGLDRDPDGSYWAISDDRGGERGTPRFYNLSIDVDTAPAVALHLKNTPTN